MGEDVALGGEGGGEELGADVVDVREGEVYGIVIKGYSRNGLGGIW